MEYGKWNNYFLPRALILVRFLAFPNRLCKIGDK